MASDYIWDTYISQLHQVFISKAVCVCMCKMKVLCPCHVISEVKP